MRRQASGHPSFAGLLSQHAARMRKLALRPCQDNAVPEIPEPHPDPDPNAAGHRPGDDDEASVRLLLVALVRRLRCQPLELAERAVGYGGGFGQSEPHL